MLLPPPQHWYGVGCRRPIASGIPFMGYFDCSMLLGLAMAMNSEGTNVVDNYGNDINQGLQKDYWRGFSNLFSAKSR